VTRTSSKARSRRSATTSAKHAHVCRRERRKASRDRLVLPATVRTARQQSWNARSKDVSVRGAYLFPPSVGDERAQTAGEEQHRGWLGSLSTDARGDQLATTLDDPRLADSFGPAFIQNGIDAYMTVCGFVAARAGILISRSTITSADWKRLWGRTERLASTEKTNRSTAPRRLHAGAAFFYVRLPKKPHVNYGTARINNQHCAAKTSQALYRWSMYREPRSGWMGVCTTI
jgi:hypothetical protein